MYEKIRVATKAHPREETQVDPINSQRSLTEIQIEEAPAIRNSKRCLSKFL